MAGLHVPHTVRGPWKPGSKYGGPFSHSRASNNVTNMDVPGSRLTMRSQSQPCKEPSVAVTMYE
jgi:hypothetical protein